MEKESFSPESVNHTPVLSANQSTYSGTAEASSDLFLCSDLPHLQRFSKPDTQQLQKHITYSPVCSIGSINRFLCMCSPSFLIIVWINATRNENNQHFPKRSVDQPSRASTHCSSGCILRSKKRYLISTKGTSGKTSSVGNIVLWFPKERWILA